MRERLIMLVTALTTMPVAAGEVVSAATRVKPGDVEVARTIDAGQAF